jgi:hypothetical protein
MSLFLNTKITFLIKVRTFPTARRESFLLRWESFIWEENQSIYKKNLSTALARDFILSIYFYFARHFHTSEFPVSSCKFIFVFASGAINFKHFASHVGGKGAATT